MSCYTNFRTFIFICLFLSIPTASRALTVTATADEKGQNNGELRAMDEAGKLLWTVNHPSVQRGASLNGPFLIGDAWIYSVGGDVLELDAQGRVAKRTQYPATIASLRVEGDKVWVLLESTRGNAIDTAEVLHKGKRGGHGPWGSFPFVALRLTQDLPEGTPDSMFVSEWEPAGPLAALEQAEETDLTNPMLSANLGLGYTALKKPDQADAAFELAIQRSQTWSDDLMVCGVLERAQKAALAQTTCARALSRMQASGVRPEAIWSLILVVSVTADLRKAMEAAIEAKDVEAVNRIAGYFRTTFPNSEGAEFAWASLAEWMNNQGASDNAKVWKTAHQDSISGHPARGTTERTRMIDLALLFMVAGNLALAFAGLAMGIRAEDRKPASKDWRTWLPVPTSMEFVSLVVFISAIFAAGYTASREVVLIAENVSMPLSATTDGLAAPEVVTWLKDLETTPSVTELRDFSKQDLESLQKGLPRPNSPGLDLVLDVIHERAAARAGISPMAVFDVAAQEQANPFSAYLFGFATLFNLLFFGAIGRVAARLLGPKNKAFSVVLGGYNGPVGVWVAAIIVAGLLYVATPMGSILTGISTPAFTNFYGLKALEVVPNLKPDMTVMIVILALGLGVHVAGVALAWRKAQA